MNRSSKYFFSVILLDLGAHAVNILYFQNRDVGFWINFGMIAMLGGYLVWHRS